VKPQLQRVGTSQSPIVIIDDFSGAVEEIAQIADSLAPFPPVAGVSYPGVRRVIGAADEQAYAYVMTSCEHVAPFVGGGFGVSSFDLTEASFSVVTTPPDALQPVQRVPHFDSPDPNILAMLHYLRVPEGSGTAFYRHRSTGIERVANDNLGRLAASADRELTEAPPAADYFSGSNAFFEQIGRVEAVPDRLIIYHGSLLHSGVIPRGMTFSADPREGRLTANFFIRGGAK
jgi:hypothetical protein